MKTLPRISIVIATYNGSTKLPYLLKSLAQQTIRDFEMVIVVDGSTDNTLEVVEQHRPLFQMMKVIVQENGGRSKVRNRGVKEATGQLLIFYDDDMVMEKDSVERHVNFHTDISYQALLGGMQAEFLKSQNTDIQRYKSFLNEKWLKKYRDIITRMDISNLFFSAANSSMTTETFFRLGGFDERLTDAEDYDLALRALEAGIPVFFDKKNVGEHRDFITCAGYIRRQRMYRKANLRLSQLHPDLHAAAVPNTSLEKRFIYKVFANPLIPGLIDKQFFIWLPRALRFRLYDLTIQALSVEYPNVIL